MKRLFNKTILLNVVLFFVIAFTGVALAQGPPPTQGGNPPPAPTNTITSTSPFGTKGGILEPPGGGVLDGVYIPEHLPYRKPMPYVYEREADIMWSKRIWRVIDLREKINHPLYFPTEPLAKRPSLWAVLQSGIYTGKINTYFGFDVFTNEFGPPLTLQEISKAMTEMLGMKDSIGDPIMDSTGNQVMVPDTLKPDDIRQYYLKEDWFFEKQRSVMDVRIIAIAPVIEVNDEVNGKYTYKPLFWLYYPAIRDYLAQFYCYNPYNDAEWRTYDEIFHKRMFNSYTYMESNVYNRPIAAYLGGQGMEQMLESERIKDDIFKFEHDMWHF
jgi:gliding motility associated protien GldN